MITQWNKTTWIYCEEPTAASRFFSVLLLMSLRELDLLLATAVLNNWFIMSIRPAQGRCHACFFTVTLLVTLIYRSTVLLPILYHIVFENCLGSYWIFLNTRLEPRRESAGGFTWRRMDGPVTEKLSELSQDYPTTCTLPHSVAQSFTLQRAHRISPT